MRSCLLGKSALSCPAFMAVFRVGDHWRRLHMHIQKNHAWESFQTGKALCAEICIIDINCGEDLIENKNTANSDRHLPQNVWYGAHHTSQQTFVVPTRLETGRLHLSMCTWNQLRLATRDQGSVTSVMYFNLWRSNYLVWTVHCQIVVEIWVIAVRK